MTDHAKALADALRHALECGEFPPDGEHDGCAVQGEMVAALNAYNAAYDAHPVKEANVWHEGSKSFYRAILVKKLTPEEALHHPLDIYPAEAATRENGGEQWYLGTLNDGLFIINKPPRPSSEDAWHDRPDGPSLAICVSGLDVARAQSIVTAHNAALSTHQQQGAQSELQPVKRWPFVETPGEFSARLWSYLSSDEQPWRLLPALRTALIENPPTLSKEYAALVLSRAPQPDTVTELLGKVRDFHYGLGRFNFSDLPDDQRANASFDAWQEIQFEIDTALREPK